MTPTKPMSPDEIANAIIDGYPGCQFDVAQDILRRVHRHLMMATHARRAPVSAIPRPDSSSAIIAAVCAYYEVSERELKNVGRVGRVARARQMCWALFRERLGLTYDDIGKRFGRDHTTVSSGVARVDQTSADWAELNARFDAARFDVGEAAE